MRYLMLPLAVAPRATGQSDPFTPLSLIFPHNKKPISPSPAAIAASCGCAFCVRGEGHVEMQRLYYLKQSV